MSAIQVGAEQNKAALGTQEGNKRDTSQSPAHSNAFILLACFSGIKSRHITHSSGENLSPCPEMQLLSAYLPQQDFYHSL